MGIGFSTHDVITLSTVARWFVKHRGMMSGIIKVGTGAGQLMVPLIATALIAVYGWRSAYLVIGALTLMTLVVVTQFLRRHPQGKGLLPDGFPDTCRTSSRRLHIDNSVAASKGRRYREIGAPILKRKQIYINIYTVNI